MFEEYETRELHLHAYLRLIHYLITSFTKFHLISLVRAENTMTDALSKLATTDQGTLKDSVYLEILKEPSTITRKVVDIDKEIS